MQKLILRTKQVQNLIFSQYFQSEKLLEESLYNGYTSQEEIDYYSQNAFNGLSAHEQDVFDYLEQKNDLKNMLVIGCGSGREVFAFEKLGLEMIGMDIIPAMIALAQNKSKEINSRARFFANSFPTLNDLGEQLQFIFLSPLILNYIQGREKRIQYLRKLRNLLLEGGEIFIYPSIQKIRPFSLEWFSSKLLQLNSWIRRWKFEKGDHAMTTYRGRGELMYFYHYPLKGDFLAEVQAAGYESLEFVNGYFRLT